MVPRFGALMLSYIVTLEKLVVVSIVLRISFEFSTFDECYWQQGEQLGSTQGVWKITFA